MLKTALTELSRHHAPHSARGHGLGGYLGIGRAVSEAGGLGIIGAGSAPPDFVRQQIRAPKRTPPNPMDVNVPLFNPW